MGDRGSPRIHDVALSRREALLFEAGIKLGGIFHQYIGIPVATRTARPLARVIEQAVGLQPFVERVRVRVRLAAVRPAPRSRGRFSYRYLTADMLDARVVLRDGNERVVARLAYRSDLRYPLMRVESVRRGPEGRGRSARRRRQSPTSGPRRSRSAPAPEAHRGKA
jgi:hypothetical protein